MHIATTSQTKTCYAVITADTDGNVYYAAPLDDGGNFQYNVSSFLHVWGPR